MRTTLVCLVAIAVRASATESIGFYDHESKAFLFIMLAVSIQHSAALQGLSRYDAISKITKSMHYDNLGKCGHLVFTGPVLQAATQARARTCIHFHFVRHSLSCGASCDSSHILA